MVQVFAKTCTFQLACSFPLKVLRLLGTPQSHRLWHFSPSGFTFQVQFDYSKKFSLSLYAGCENPTERLTAKEIDWTKQKKVQNKIKDEEIRFCGFLFMPSNYKRIQPSPYHVLPTAPPKGCIRLFCTNFPYPLMRDVKMSRIAKDGGI